MVMEGTGKKRKKNLDARTGHMSDRLIQRTLIVLYVIINV
jgi:hypothetical protein